jgi:hypothetical protein
LATLLTGFRKSVAESLEHLLVLTSRASDRVLREFARDRGRTDMSGNYYERLSENGLTGGGD